MNQPPCCSINTFVICSGCGYRVCEGHWFDKCPTSLDDGFHVPTVDVKGKGATGQCFNCKGTKWVKTNGKPF